MTATVRVMRTSAEEALIKEFAEKRGDLPGLAAERDAAMQDFAARGLPHRRIEEWKYFDLRAFLREAKPLAEVPGPLEIAAIDATSPILAGLAAPRRVFVNAHHFADLGAGQMPKGVELRDLGEALDLGDRLIEAHLGRLATRTGDGALPLNAAFMRSGLILHVDAGATIEQPLYIDHRFAGEARSVYPRSIVVLGDGARLTLIESEAGPGDVGYHWHGVSEIILGVGAELTHVTSQCHGSGALALHQGFVEIGAGACYRTFALEEGAAEARRQLHVRFAGEGATLALNGATLATGRQVLDTTLLVDHAVPGCSSRETFKYVLGGEARGVFQGKIVVRPDAQKTDGRMNARGLLLSEGSEFDAKPELEIFADDVQCAHGATAGELDEGLMFYLRARGIPVEEAKALLVTAFVGEALEAIEGDELRSALAGRIDDWLKRNLR